MGTKGRKTDRQQIAPYMGIKKTDRSINGHKRDKDRQTSPYMGTKGTNRDRQTDRQTATYRPIGPEMLTAANRLVC